MNFKRVVFVFALLAYTPNTFSFTFELIVTTVNTMIIQNGSSTSSDCARVTFFSDYHRMSSGEQEQIATLVDYLQEQKDNQLFHIFIEQASEINRLSAYGYEVLCMLDRHIKQVQPPLTHVTLDNVEVRHSAGPGMDILKDYTYGDRYMEHQTDDAKKTIGTITFQDILDEFNQLKQSLATYYCSHKNEAIAKIYTDCMKRADSHYEQLKRKISNSNNTVLAYAQEQYNQRRRALNGLKQEEMDREVVSSDIELSFMDLFDLNLLKSILTSDSRNILVFAGGEHTRTVASMLSTLQASTIFHIKNAIIQPVLQKNGFTRNEEVVSPVTGNQIIQALSAQPKSTLARYAPTVGYMTMAVAVLYYLLFVVLSEPLHGHA